MHYSVNKINNDNLFVVTGILCILNSAARNDLVTAIARVVTGRKKRGRMKISCKQGISSTYSNYNNSTGISAMNYYVFRMGNRKFTYMYLRGRPPRAAGLPWQLRVYVVPEPQQLRPTWPP